MPKTEPKKITKAFMKYVMKEFEKSVFNLAEVAYEQGRRDAFKDRMPTPHASDGSKKE